MLVYLLLLIVCCECVVQGPPGKQQAIPTPQSCDECAWVSDVGARYELSRLCEEQRHSVMLDRPRGGRIEFAVCGQLACGEEQKTAAACLYVPGNKATSSGQAVHMASLEPNIPTLGLRIELKEGEHCGLTNKPRTTVIDLKCSPHLPPAPHQEAATAKIKGWEGEGSDVCNYYITVHTPHACPQLENKYSAPKITAVSGCTDTVPRLSTHDCPPQGGVTLTLHGLAFPHSADSHARAQVSLGSLACEKAIVLSQGAITCTLPPASSTGAEELAVSVTFTLVDSFGSGAVEETTTSTSVSLATVSYKAVMDYRRHFSNFTELGVGGLGPQIQQLYQRAFASRGVPLRVLKQLGIEHAKGILLYGPPGSGKTLLARSIAKILHTQQVKLINAPEIMSKFLGESEKNLRSQFVEAEKAWNDYGEASDLHVIIIDEIDAICKQRGKSDDSSAAAAYDSVVNQLLSMLDGLKEMHNVLVIGMTNRKELLDPALLRPGRLEIHIEFGLPDLQGRFEIFSIHTASMQENGLLGEDVDLHELALNTSQYSGAEIAGIVRLAASYALDRAYTSDHPSTVLVGREDFVKAVGDTQPFHTQKPVAIEKELLPRGYIPCGESHDNVLGILHSLVRQIKKSKYSVVETALLYGPKGTGKTALVGQLALTADFSSIKLISPSSFRRLTISEKFDLLIETFTDARTTDLSLVILDDLHFFLEVVSIGHEVQANAMLLNQLATSLARHSRGKILVVATVFTADSTMELWPVGKIGLQSQFNHHLYVPPLDSASVQLALSAMNFTMPTSFLPHDILIPIQQLLVVSDCVGNSSEGAQNQPPMDQRLWKQCLKLAKYELSQRTVENKASINK